MITKGSINGQLGCSAKCCLGEHSNCMGMEGAQLGVVEAKETRKKLEGARPYRQFLQALFGDTKESSMMLDQAQSKPIKLSTSHDIAPRVMPFVHQTVNTYGKNSFVWMGPIPKKEIFNKDQNFRRPSANPMIDLVAQGLSAFEDGKWAKHRKIIHPAFHLEKLKGMLPTFYQSCSEMINEWERLVSKEGSCELDVWPCLQTLSADVISRLNLEVAIKREGKYFSFCESKKKFTQQPSKVSLPTKQNKRMKKIYEEISVLLKGIINKREEAMKLGEASKHDLLGLLMESNLKEIREHGNDRNTGMSLEDVIEECKLFYLAGQETTSVLLVWAMVLLSQNQNWQARAREEVLQIFESNPPTYDTLSHLKVVSIFT
ncbi:Cytochrome P450 superfamily protein [Prunus dulcis]|uniref:Cytochrome P450 superfamily protein n=1 Tax=Prunus dulcis TaxID=3755 RepID=A0A4Y1RBI9_PRUDU|nr:Cytochrome P450 superfamily protein [Prunus dulcis]